MDTYTKKLVFTTLLLVTFLVYGNTFRNQWTYDDTPVVVENPRAKSLEAFVTGASLSRPLRELTYILDYQLFGDKPAGYHLQQLVWHAANGCFLYLVFEALGIAGFPALAGVLLFLVHPLQVESVASIGHRKELLAQFFVLGSFLLYLRAGKASGPRRIWFLGFVPVAFVLALLANETALFVPLLLVLYELLFLDRDDRILLHRPVVTVTGFSVLALIAAWRLSHLFSTEQLLILYSQNNFFASQSYFPLVGGILKAFAFYLGKIVIPVNLSPEYVITIPGSLGDVWMWLSLLALASVCLAFVAAYRRSRIAAFGIGWFLVAYLPVSNIIPSGYIAADRYMYLCLPGIALLLAAVLQSQSGKSWRLGAMAVFVLLAALTVLQNGVWRDPLTLWRHAARVNPDSTGANLSAAAKLLDAGDLAAAEIHAKKVIELNRFMTFAYFLLARIEERQGNLPGALNHYRIFAAMGGAQYPNEASYARSLIPVLEERLRSSGGANKLPEAGPESGK